MNAYEIEIQAGVDAENSDHALVLVALDLLQHAFGSESELLGDGMLSRVPSGYVGAVDFSISVAGVIDR